MDATPNQSAAPNLPNPAPCNNDQNAQGDGGRPTALVVANAPTTTHQCELPAQAKLAGPGLQSDRRPVLHCMADIEPRPVTWIWPGRIAAGRITLAVGMPGAGKSFLTCDLASRISTGTPWPDGSECPRGSVLFITAEDDPHDTIRPRLDALHADVTRIHLLSGALRCTDRETREVAITLSDVDVLGESLQSIPDCRLVVVDPIGSFLGSECDAHRDNQVRAVLDPVKKLAEQHGTAVLIVAHRRKSAGAYADDTVLGSRAFTGIARNVWHLCRDTEDQNRRLLLSGKCNLGAEQGGLAFTIEGDPARTHWESGPVTMTADEALARENGRTGKTSAVDAAAEWLKGVLGDGPMPSEEVKKLAMSDSIAWRTVERAKEKLGVVSRPSEFGGKWVWALPAVADSDGACQDLAESAKLNLLADSEETVADSVEDRPLSVSFRQELAESANNLTLADSEEIVADSWEDGPGDDWGEL
jgi:hypothetical protein